MGGKILPMEPKEKVRFVFTCIMQEKGLTGYELSASLGLSKGYVAGIMRGNRASKQTVNMIRHLYPDIWKQACAEWDRLQHQKEVAANGGQAQDAAARGVPAEVDARLNAIEQQIIRLSTSTARVQTLLESVAKELGVEVPYSRNGAK